MLNKLMSKIKPTMEGLKKDVLNGKFNEKVAKTVISSPNVDINEQDENGDTLLNICLKDHRFIEAMWFVENNINPMIENNDGINGVRIAVQRGNVQILDKLINSCNVDLNQKDKNQRSLLQDAVIYGHSNMISLLTHYLEDFNSVDTNNRNVAFDAIAYGDEEITTKLLDTTKDLDLNVIDNSGKTILHHKDIEENEELSIKLLEKGADPTICDNEGNNFLLKIALKGKHGEAMLQTAVRLGCDLNSKVSNKNSILMEVMFAFSKIPIEEKERRADLKSMARKLIKYGIDIESRNIDNETVLFELIRASDIEGCAFVLENGLNVNHQNNEQETALSLAIYKGIENHDMIILLLQYGANPTLKNKNNQCVGEVLNNIILHTHLNKKLVNQEILDKINSNGNYLILLKEVLNGSKCKFDYLDSEGNPLFFTPFLNGNSELTRLYFKAGVDVNLCNEEGNNLFYEYNLMIFEKGKPCENYKKSLLFLLSNNSNILAKNKDDQTIFSKISLIPECNLELFRLLNEITRYDYTTQDMRGRTIMHSCVWGGNTSLVNLIYGVDKTVQNISDFYNILPITYSALLGNQELVHEFLKKESKISTGKIIPKAIKENFQPMLKNLDSLTQNCKNADLLKKIEILVDTTRRDLKVNAIV